MYWSRLFIPTLREPSAELLQRAGYIRQTAGVHGYLFLAQRSLLKIAKIIREEMEAIGGQEIVLPRVATAHEETVACIAAGELRSYKQLPQIWYQIQMQFREEPRPKTGSVRVQQFLTKESYSFDLSDDGLDLAYQKHRDAYRRIFDRCGLQYVATGSEFMVRSEGGENSAVQCPACGYAANLETAVSRASAPALADPEGDLAPEEFHTPDKKTIADIAEFTGLPESSQMKSLVMVADGKGVLALVRGDHQMSETRLAGVLGSSEVRAAFPDEIRQWFGADAGSLGPVGVKGLRVIADRALEGRRNMISGANRNDYHLRHVTPGEDFEAEFFDLRQVAAGDTCASCGHALDIFKAVEIGRLRRAGDRYSKAAGLHVTNEAGGEVPPVMGSYGIGTERILSAAVEQYADKDGMSLPPSIAPFFAVITPVNMSVPELREAGQALYSACRESGLDVLLDDRDERPGVKFKDADLVGIPYRVNIGKKLAQGLVEVVERRTKRATDVPVNGVVAFLKSQ